MQIKANIKAPRHWPLWGNPLGTCGFFSQRVSNAENVSIWWRHHAEPVLLFGNWAHRSMKLQSKYNYFYWREYILLTRNNQRAQNSFTISLRTVNQYCQKSDSVAKAAHFFSKHVVAFTVLLPTGNHPHPPLENGKCYGPRWSSATPASSERLFLV